MRIAINGAGVGGPTLAWWLRRHGHEPVLFEEAPALRTGGYVIDFWGVGYDIADKMGLLPELHRRGYEMEEVRMVNRDGKKVAGLDVNTIRALLEGRYVSIARGDIASTIYHACDGIETHFGTWITGIDDRDECAHVALSDGTTREFDLVVGADGLHSHVRSLAFGPEEEFEHFLGYHVAALTLPHYSRRDDLVFVAHTIPGRHLARIALHDGSTAFLFIWRDDARADPTSADERQVLREVFGEMTWEAPEVLARLDEVESIYFDRVSQIRMDGWTRGRVAVLGDAAACVSLLAGEGTGLAITEAYVLAGELHRAGSDYATAFREYESRLRPFIADKQRAAPRFAGFFAPKNRFSLAVRDLLINISSVPFIAKRFIGASIDDDIELPTYEADC